LSRNFYVAFDDIKNCSEKLVFPLFFFGLGSTSLNIAPSSSCAKQKGPGRDKALGRAKNPLNFVLLIGRPLNFGGQFTLRLTYCQVLWHAGFLD
jgi:hypothetical protein